MSGKAKLGSKWVAEAYRGIFLEAYRGIFLSSKINS